MAHQKAVVRETYFVNIGAQKFFYRWAKFQYKLQGWTEAAAHSGEHSIILCQKF